MTFTVKALLLNFLSKVYSTNMTSLREREEKREKETLTATNSKAAAGSALSKGRCSKNGHCPKADCRNALALLTADFQNQHKKCSYLGRSYTGELNVDDFNLLLWDDFVQEFLF